MESIDHHLKAKADALVECLGKFERLGVAFSGGIDSTLLLAAAQKALGDHVVAFTADSPIHPCGEKALAIALAGEIRVRHVVFQTHELNEPLFSANTKDRCYHCKKGLFSVMSEMANTMGIECLAHGANMDDLSDFRPGYRASVEMQIVAPLIEARLNKQDIRGVARLWGLSNWDRPAMACLATRVPYGTPLNLDLLARIDQAETIVRRLGAKNCRVRHHGNLARVETDAESITQLSSPQLRQHLVDALKSLGYIYVCLDMEGYISGKMNRTF